MFVVVDGMSVVHEVMSAVCPKACKDVADTFSETVESKCKSYEGYRVIFDNYGRENSINDIIRRRKFRSPQSSARAYLLAAQPSSMTRSYFWLTVKPEQ